MSKRAYERRLKRKRAEERRARRRQRRTRTIATWAGVAVAIGVGIALFLALSGGDESTPSAAATGTATASPTSPASPPAGCRPPGTVAPKETSFEKPPPVTVDGSKRYTATLETTCGTLRIDLDPKLARKTVNNFVFLAREGFYDGTIFHRVQSEATFAIVQGGDPKGDGSGGPGYQYGGEKPPADTRYLRGTVAMANSGDPSSNGSQFFIVVHDWADLPASYTVFGKVTDEASLAALERMITAKGSPLGGLGVRPEPAIGLIKVTIRES